MVVAARPSHERHRARRDPGLDHGQRHGRDRRHCARPATRLAARPSRRSVGDTRPGGGAGADGVTAGRRRYRLLFALGRRGLVGQWLDSWFGITLPFTTAGAVVAASFVALPFFVTTVEASLRQAGTDLEEAAAVTGAGPLTAFVTVTVPASRDAILAGLALAWARALGEFGATITFAGNLAGRTRTLPLEIFLALESDPESAVAVSVLLLSVSFTVLIVLRGRWFSRG